MEGLPKLEDLKIEGKRVLVRGDFDVESGENPRAESIREIVRYLQGKGAAKIKVIGHTSTEYDLASQLGSEFPEVEFDSGLRSNPGEKENNLDFAKELADDWEVYVNEAFATSHRSHASIVGVPKVMRERGKDVCVGLHFAKEIENLGRVRENPKRPVVVIIGGVKKDKLDYLEDFKKFADKILIGGRLPLLVQSSKFKIQSVEKVTVADLNQDKEDITVHSIEKFEEEIEKAGTIVVAGPMGKYEDEGQTLGTKRVLESVVESSAFKVAGGGDTEQAISAFGLMEKFDWVSVGGGATLEFLAKGTLAGIEALVGEV